MKHKVWILLVLVATVLLTACATQPTTDYALTPAEMKTAGAASINQTERVPVLYAHAEFVQQSTTGKN